jgi:SAM-dependent methyltransferase
MWYQLKVNLLKIPWINRVWRRRHAYQGHLVGNYHDLPKYINQFAPGRSFVDVGCMWGVNGEYAFIAEEAGASIVKGVDVFGPTPEFIEKKTARGSQVHFILGDAGSTETIAQVGVMDVVFCAGVLYHHPSPFDLIVALRRMCGQTLILRTSTIPEINNLPNAAVYFPFLNAKDCTLWNLSRLGVSKQVGISDGFEPAQGYGNWFWGLTPSCLESILKTAGFQIEQRHAEAFAQTVICKAVNPPFSHNLPDQTKAGEIAAAISKAGIAHPS